MNTNIVPRYDNRQTWDLETLRPRPLAAHCIWGRPTCLKVGRAQSFIDKVIKSYKVDKLNWQTAKVEKVFSELLTATGLPVVAFSDLNCTCLCWPLWNYVKLCETRRCSFCSYAPSGGSLLDHPHTGWVWHKCDISNKTNVNKEVDLAESNRLKISENTWNQLSIIGRHKELLRNMVFKCIRMCIHLIHEYQIWSSRLTTSFHILHYFRFSCPIWPPGRGTRNTMNQQRSRWPFLTTYDDIVETWNGYHAVGDGTLTCSDRFVASLFVFEFTSLIVGSLSLSNRPPGPGARSFPAFTSKKELSTPCVQQTETVAPLTANFAKDESLLDSVRFCSMESAWTVSVKHPNRNQVVALLSVTVWHLIG